MKLIIQERLALKPRAVGIIFTNRDLEFKDNQRCGWPKYRVSTIKKHVKFRTHLFRTDVKWRLRKVFSFLQR